MYPKYRNFKALFLVPLAFLTPVAGAPGRQTPVQPPSAPAELVLQARQALDRGIAFYTTLAVHGGYVYSYSLDRTERWGEAKVTAQTVEVQAPGTPAVGSAYLRAYRATGESRFLAAAQATGGALIQGQNRLGGWGHTIDFSRPAPDLVSFDDNQAQGALRFLMDLDRDIDTPELDQAIRQALQMMLDSQLEDGGWPHQYPRQNNYHDFATFNDGGINDCIEVLLEAHRRYGSADIRNALRRAARFLILSQLPPPQPGWAQQYNPYLQPAWARSFEPPSVCPAVTLKNVHSLVDLFLYLGDRTYLEPIPDALAWVAGVRLPNGKWPRFVELGTDRPLYYDRGRLRVHSVQELSLERRTGYAYEHDLSGRLAAATERFEAARRLSVRPPAPPGGEVTAPAAAAAPSPVPRLSWSELQAQVREVIAAQDSEGRWITRKDRFRDADPGDPWDGGYRILDRINSRRFCRNIDLLCEFLERARTESEP